MIQEDPLERKQKFWQHGWPNNRNFGKLPRKCMPMIWKIYWKGKGNFGSMAGQKNRNFGKLPRIMAP